MVPTTVAMEFAVSWKPLMYSKTRATMMTAKTMVVVSMRGGEASGILEDYEGGGAADGAAAFDAFAEEVVEVLADDRLAVAEGAVAARHAASRRLTELLASFERGVQLHKALVAERILDEVVALLGERGGR